jgi:dihydroorotate dehydrogenase (NAD+) catalytic subunit
LNKKISIPLFVKLNPNVTDIVKIGKAAEEGGADALVAINTIAAMVIDVNTRRPILSHGSGGLSGKAIHPIAIKKVYDLYKNVKIPIIGCGGIKSWKDAVEFFLAGARSVQIGTSFYQGFDFVESINIGIINYLTQNNFNSLSEIIGLTHKFNIQEVPKYDE